MFFEKLVQLLENEDVSRVIIWGVRLFIDIVSDCGEDMWFLGD